MGRDEQEIMGKMEQIILMQKLEKLKNNCLIMIEKSIKGTWAFNFWTKTFHIWDPTMFEKFRAHARKKSNINRGSLNWEEMRKK